MTDTNQPSDHAHRDVLAVLANMSFQTLCQEIAVLPESDSEIEKLRSAARDDEKSLIDLLIALKSARLCDIAPLFANADDDPANAKLSQSDVPDNMLSLLTALKASTSTDVE